VWPPLANGAQHVLCIRSDSPRPAEGGIGGCWHTLGDGTDYPLPSMLPSLLSSARLAPIEVRDQVYRALFAEHPLLERHSKELARRGLSTAAILARGYKSWGSNGYQRAPIAKQVLQLNREAIDVPGIIVRDGRAGQYVTLSGSPGIAIPLLNAAGQMQAQQILCDDQSHGKYLFLSSASRGGASPGTPVHVARPPAGSTRTGRIWVTEGGLKADIAAEHLGEVVVAVPGVNSLKHLEETLADLMARGELDSLVIALDSDWHTNAAVAKARNLIAERAARMGIPCGLADWPVECKGLDDILVAGGRNSIKLTGYQVQGNGPRQVVDAPAADPAPVEITVSLVEARRQLQRGLDEYLARDRKAEPNVGILCNADPGTGKSHAITKSLNRAIKKRRKRRICVFVGRHEQAQEEPGRENWGVIHGRTHALKDNATPCAFPERQKKLAELRIMGQEGCKACPNHDSCKTNKLREDTVEPFYWNQFEQKDQRITVLQAGHLMATSTWQNCSVVVLDDLDLDSLQVERVVLKRTDLEFASAWATNRPSSPYALGQPLVHLCSELTRHAPEGEFSLSGPALIARLETIATDHKTSLLEAIEAASRAQEPVPFPEGSALHTACLDELPRRFLGDLVAVLRHELQQSKIDREVVGWNRRLEASRVLGGDVEFTLTLRRELPIESLKGKDVILVDGSADIERARRLLPFIDRWIVVAPKVKIPASVKVVQYVDKGWGKRALHDPAVQEKALAVIGRHIEAHPGEKIGLLSYKFFGAIVKKAFPDAKIKFGWFYGQRGTNRFKDCDALIVFGTPRPNPKGFEQTAEAIFWDENPLNTQTMLVTHRIGKLAVKVREYVDPRLRELARAKTQEELRQAVLRIRPLEVEGYLDREQLNFWEPEKAGEDQPAQRRRATVYIHSNVPIPGLKVEAHRTATPSTPPPARPDLVAPVDLEAATRDLLDRQLAPTEERLADALAAGANTTSELDQVDPSTHPPRHRVRTWKKGLQHLRQPCGTVARANPPPPLDTG
jgi:hypothetical protein